MPQVIRQFLRDDEGATMVEYGLMVALIAVVSLGVVASLGTWVWNAFDQSTTAVAAPNGTPRPPTTPQVP